MKNIIEKWKNKKIAVIGDFILDEYVVGTVNGISKEAPVAVVDIESNYYRLGGAANVANNLKELGAIVYCFGVLGDDKQSEILRFKINNQAIVTYGLITEARKTTVKKRIMAHNQQLLRLDQEDTHNISKETEDKIIEQFKKTKFDAIIMSDYAKGVLTKRLVKKIIELSKCIITVDPKPKNIQNYKGVTAITPNQREYEKMNKKKIKAKSILITQSEKGMELITDKRTHINTAAKDICDVTGAGDTVISIFTLALTTGATFEESAKLANAGAGIVVSKLGTSTVNKEELLRGIND